MHLLLIDPCMIQIFGPDNLPSSLILSFLLCLIWGFAYVKADK